MPRRSRQRKHGTTRGSPRRSRTAKASRISCLAVKSRCACEWGGWGRLSVDGLGQHNPVRSEGPWGRAVWPLERRCSGRRRTPTLSGLKRSSGENTKGGGKPIEVMGMPGAGLTGTSTGKAPPERPALEPYWGKPAVRNLRGDDGNVGIIRSPVRAIVLPDRCTGGGASRGGGSPGSRPARRGSRRPLRPSATGAGATGTGRSRSSTPRSAFGCAGTTSTSA